MKRSAFKKTLCAVLSAVLVLSFIAPLSASYLDHEDLLTETDREKLTAFWAIVNPETGLTNGETIFVTDYPTAWLDEIGGHEYTGTALTPLARVTYFNPETGSFQLSFDHQYELMHLEPLPDGAPGVVNSTVYPDLYGELDLSGTSLYRLGTHLPDHPTHITSINLNGCEQLSIVQYFWDDVCTSFSALDCPSLWQLCLLEVALRNIDIQPRGFDSPLHVSAFGAGSVGLDYIYDEGQEIGTELRAYPEADNFTGWFANGECVSTETVFVYNGYGNVTACFGGDADGSGSITVADAVIAMRMAMGVIASTDTDQADVNGNGSVDVADAIMILRFAMGII